MMDFFRKKVKETKIEVNEDKNLETETTSTIIQIPQPNQTTYSGFYTLNLLRSTFFRLQIPSLTALFVSLT